VNPAGVDVQQPGLLGTRDTRSRGVMVGLRLLAMRTQETPTVDLVDQH
jgi:hypothetical protein